MISNQIHDFINHVHKEKRMTLIYLIASLAVLCVPFTICSLIVSGTANAGFNIVLTTILNCTYISVAYYIIEKSKASLSIGFLLGSTFAMLLLNFQTAIYWGQLSRCTVYIPNFDQYSCSQRNAYASVSAFSVLIFVILIPFETLLFLWKSNLIEDSL